MAKYVFVVYAVSEDEGLGRLRLFGQFKTEKDAWEAVVLLWGMMVADCGCVSIYVRRTISFGSRGIHSASH